VLIGKDTRISGYLIESTLEAGLIASGIDVYLTGPIPTPAIAYLTKTLRLDLGIVISASHNLYQDNGIKFFDENGSKLSDDWEYAVEKYINEPELTSHCVATKQLGKAHRVDDAAGRYIEFCKNTFPNHYDLKGVKLVVDCAHGAAYHIAPKVFHELGATVISIADKPDGFNINAQCGATDTDWLVAETLRHGADLGIALDGDADRLMMCDHQGVVYNGDHLLLAMITPELEAGTLKGVVGTVMTNLAIEKFLAEKHIPFIRCAVGDRHILENLAKQGWHYGGETSGHLLSLQHHSTGDGLISSLQILATLQYLSMNLADIIKRVPLYPQKMVNLKNTPRSHPDFMTAISQVQEQFLVKYPHLKGEQGRVIIRPSGTEPVVRVTVEAQTQELVDNYTELLVHELNMAFSKLTS
jgi:phosphoglucosamine mutase